MTELFNYNIQNVEIKSYRKLKNEELLELIELIKKRHPHSFVKTIFVEEDGEEEIIKGEVHPYPFNRLRRITGYLVGTVDRFNDGKKAEEKDRVKHAITSN